MHYIITFLFFNPFKPPEDGIVRAETYVGVKE
jgi:hypothetical protein